MFSMKIFDVLFGAVDSLVLLTSTVLILSCDLVSQGNHVNRSCHGAADAMLVGALLRDSLPFLYNASRDSVSLP